jgi:penicillin-binding protein 1A
MDEGPQDEGLQDDPFEEERPQGLVRIGGGKVFSRVAITLLVLCAIAVGSATGLLFVYNSDLPQIQELENYRPDVVTEVYADDGTSIGTFALQRRILLTYDQIPPVLRDAVISTEDRHFMDHWGVDFPRVAEAAWADLMHRRIVQGASTITMQLAGGLFLNRSDRSFRRKIEEAMLAIQIERHYTKQQIFTMYSNQIYLGAGNYGFEAASESYFGKPVGELTLPEAALLAAIVRGPTYSPVLYAKRALERRNLVFDLMVENGKITREQAHEAQQTPLGLNVTYPQNSTVAPYFVEEIRQKLEQEFGPEAVHQEGLRAYTSLNTTMQRAAVQAVRDGLHAYDRRHGWRGNLPNIFHEHLGTLRSYESPDWRDPVQPGEYVTGLITAVDRNAAVAKIGPYRAVITAPDFAWTDEKSPEQLLQIGDLANLYIESVNGSTAKVQLEQIPAAQAALLAIDNATGEIKAMVGGYDFDESKYNRAVQAMRQTGSSFKVYVYATALEKGMTPFDTVLDEPITYISGGKEWAPHDYDNRFEGRISLRRALADSLNVPAVRILDQVGIENVIDNARLFGITSPLPPYLPLALGAADLTLMEHTSAFSVFPDDGIHIQPHMIRRVTSYDGAILEEARPKVTDVLPPDVSRTMVAMLEDVVHFGTGVRAQALGRPSAGKTGTTNDFTDAWYIGFTPQITAGVWVGFDDPKESLGAKETGARAALPIWLEFMQQASKGMPVETFPNVTSLEDLAATAHEEVDVPDTAPPTDLSEQGVEEKEGSPAGGSAPDVSGKPAESAQPGTAERPLAGDKPAPAVKPATTKPQQPAKPQTKPGTPSK